MFRRLESFSIGEPVRLLPSEEKAIFRGYAPNYQGSARVEVAAGIVLWPMDLVRKENAAR